MNILHYLNPQRQAEELKELNASLADYGLSSSDWLIKHAGSNRYLIENKSEPNFLFAGHVNVKKGKKVWSAIYLKSL